MNLRFCAREIAVGDVDRDALLALGGEPVDQQREIDRLALRPVPLAVGFQRGELVVEDLLAVVQQPPDQRRLAVVDAAAGDEAQQLLALPARRQPTSFTSDRSVQKVTLLLLLLHAGAAGVAVDRAALPLGRGRLTSISATMSSTVAASLSIAPDSG